MRPGSNCTDVLFVPIVFSIDLSNVGTSVEEESPYNNVDFTMLGELGHPERRP